MDGDRDSQGRGGEVRYAATKARYVALHNTVELTIGGVVPVGATAAVTYDTKPVKETAGKTDAEIPLSIKGSYSPGLSADAQYTLDASGQFAFPFHARQWAVGAVAADKRRGVDPDSFTVAGLIERIHPNKSMAFPETENELFVPAGEFSRGDTTRNFISGFVVRGSVRLPRRYSPNSILLRLFGWDSEWKEERTLRISWHQRAVPGRPREDMGAQTLLLPCDLR